MMHMGDMAYYTAEEIAHAMVMRRETLIRAAEEGKIRHIVVGGKYWFRMESVREYRRGLSRWR